jgi:hypothetical protein
LKQTWTTLTDTFPKNKSIESAKLKKTSGKFNFKHWPHIQFKNKLSSNFTFLKLKYTSVQLTQRTLQRTKEVVPLVIITLQMTIPTTLLTKIPSAPSTTTPTVYRQHSNRTANDSTNGTTAYFALTSPTTLPIALLKDASSALSTPPPKSTGKRSARCPTTRIAQ